MQNTINHQVASLITDKGVDLRHLVNNVTVFGEQLSRKEQISRIMDAAEQLEQDGAIEIRFLDLKSGTPIRPEVPGLYGEVAFYEEVTFRAIPLI